MRKPDPTGRLWIEEGQPKHGLVAEVAPLAPIANTYTFTIPEDMESRIAIGQRVEIPLGRRGRLVKGFVVSLDRREWDSTLRSVHSLVDSTSYLTPELIELGRWISDHYCCPLATTLKAMTPEATRRERGLKAVQYVRLRESQPDTDFESLSRKRKNVLTILRESKVPVSINDALSKAGCTRAVFRALQETEWIEIFERKEAPRAVIVPAPATNVVAPPYSLNDEQLAALATIEKQIDRQCFGVTLLFGVSGSGKTEVYIHAMRRVLETGRQVLLLVPEIMLTTQLVQRLMSRLPDVTVQHSALTETQRAVIWRKIAAGEARSVIGTRSAVFAPFPNLGLICIDEEQESSYKNLRAPRYHVRDVALGRAKQLGIPLVLGSATPSLETWFQSQGDPEHQRVELSHRVRDLPLPDIRIVDMRDECLEQRKPVDLSRLLLQWLEETLARGEQAILLMNRRGFALNVFCPSCKMRLTCPNCSAGLVAHSISGLCVCHYCRTSMTTPTHCSALGCGAELLHVGLGTQRVEALLKERFPQAKIRRADSDVVKHRRDYETIVEQFTGREIDVLVGTQMIAKGLDFPFVSFVGVVSADLAGMAGDFRANEKLFQLITQVAGRAGRADRPGRVVVQTFSPDIAALR
ncbi:MAG: primosomal protein N', partial [Planctomycetota bacterium]